MAKSPEQFARQLATLGSRMEANVAGSVPKAAMLLKASVQAHLGPATGGDYRLSGVGGKATRAAGGAKLGVRYTVRGKGHETTAILRATGPFHLIERDTAARTTLGRGVGRVKGRRTKANRRAARQELYSALFQATDSTAKLGNHPGTKGKHPFEKGVTRAAPKAQRILAGGVNKSLREVFR